MHDPFPPLDDYESADRALPARLARVDEGMDLMRALCATRRNLLVALVAPEDEALVEATFERYADAVARYADASRIIVALSDHNFEFQLASRADDPVAALWHLLPPEATLVAKTLGATDPTVLARLLTPSLDPVGYVADLKEAVWAGFRDIVAVDQMARGLFAASVPDDLSVLDA